MKRFVSRHWHFYPEVIVEVESDKLRVGFLHYPEEIVIDNIVAVDVYGDNIVATGSMASKLRDRVSPTTYKTIRPIEGGHVVNPQAMQYLLQYALDELIKKRLFIRQSPDIYLLLPDTSSSIERAAFRQIFDGLTTAKVNFVSSIVTVAMAGGITIPSDEVLVVKLGFDQTTIGLVDSDGQIVHLQTLSFGAHDLLTSLKQWLRKNIDLELGINDIETMLWRTLQLQNITSKRNLVLHGRSIRSGEPKRVSVKLSEANLFLVTQLESKLLKPLMRYLDDLPAGLRTSVSSRGIYLGGVLADLVGLDKWLKRQLRCYVHKVAQPDKAGIEGARLLLTQGGDAWHEYVTN